MKLSIVILNYNVRYFLELCLKSVQEAITNIDAEIIVVDNNSEDDSCIMVKELFPDVKIIENKENFGFSKGNNIGVAQAKGEYLCILNPDTVVAEDTFMKVFEFVKTIDNLGIVGCKLINGVGDFLPESKRNIPYIEAAFKKLFGNSNEYYAKHLSENETGKVDILVGAFMLLKREVYHKIGGFDEDYFMYGEDIDISYKALKLGYTNYYFGNTSVIHFKGESTLRDKNYARRFYGAMQIFYKKHFKKNVLFDILVWLGLRVVYLFSKTPSNDVKRINKYYFISDKMNENLKSVLQKDIVWTSDLNTVENNSEVIFDNNFLSYKTIINLMENNKKGKSVTYKILPKKAKFVLGSDNAITRGEVIKFN
ncbi:glycosyltransferase family 2 protein [Sabulilitoribacter multivorans]|uniref:Glycosyltransferase family 2 protein n=1 Tax=Flaviramulus multivorans TaxID=1304750 RepID=A0ABS9IIS7_9FLAO|nr:glycosyltransferase family 2 protein [Flaviramulus multivorans]MCF7560360.1 glycosyltransferase family 2 protein [Flaviramulus multivorans]